MSGTPHTTRPMSMQARVRPGTSLGFRWGKLNGLCLAAGVGVLAAGYSSLAHGSASLAPVLLVAGYCGLIPAALLVRAGEREPGE